MKNQLHRIAVLSVIVILTMAQTSFAQDDQIIYQENEGMSEIDRDKIPTSPGESEVRYLPKGAGTSVMKVIPLPKDSAALMAIPVTPSAPKIKAEKQRPAPRPTVEKQSKEEDDSILSFNFLYYMIQKYKLQDIVE